MYYNKNNHIIQNNIVLFKKKTPLIAIRYTYNNKINYSVSEKLKSNLR